MVGKRAVAFGSMFAVSDLSNQVAVNLGWTLQYVRSDSSVCHRTKNCMSIFSAPASFKAVAKNMRKLCMEYLDHSSGDNTVLINDWNAVRN
jgi:hypothetical protein